jgi:hypothetical protein
MAIRVAKTRGSQTYTESGFWGMIRAALRQKSRWWKPVKDAKDAARRAYKGVNKRQKFEYQCAKCKQWFPEKEIEVDHIIEAGSLRNGDDVKDFIERLFCEKEGLQILCKDKCHREKTLNAKNITKNL